MLLNYWGHKHCDEESNEYITMISMIYVNAGMDRPLCLGFLYDTDTWFIVFIFSIKIYID